MAKKEIGKITHYFDKIGVGVIQLSDSIKEGDKISIEGHDFSFEQNASSIQIDRQPVKKASKGQAIGLKLAQPIKGTATVFKVTV